MMRSLTRTLTLLVALAGVALSLLAPAAAPAEAQVPTQVGPVDPDPAGEQHRPYFHFSPRENWMNDPNGMVFHDDTWHLFFQHNPFGTTWGNMSWGHATSDDLFHWEQQPLAIRQTFAGGESIEDIFSGSIVSDADNTSGLGTANNPPLVALYTSAYTNLHPTHAGVQAQSLAYSLDDGQTWEKYDGNPVLDRGSANFRDPKVFRYDGPAGEYWVMVAVEAVDHTVVLYRSDNLIDWTYLSEFGDANATGGIWECPDLFELPVDGDPENTKWVMVVNLNPGSVAGGSGGQYFVGDFDGTTFASESTVTDQPAPEGTTIADFDDGTYDGWTVVNEPGADSDGPWGTSPAAGTLPGQGVVRGHYGAGLVNSFHGGDGPVGTMESASFTLDRDFLNFVVGGGRHPHQPGTQLGNEPPPGQLLFDGFELPDGTSLADAGWELTGDFTFDRNPSTVGGEYVIGEKRLNTFEGGLHGDDNQGTMTSPTFVVDDDHLSFLLGGGRRNDGSLQVELLVDGEVVRSAAGPESGALNWRSWLVAEYAGQEAQLRVADSATGGWGHLTLDHVVLGPQPAQPRSDETSVNLVVDGEVVRTATGSNSETLEWESWDVADLLGREATLRIVDNNRSAWGHLLADQFLAADTPVRSMLERYDWLDWGRDYYAAVSFSGAPDGRRVMLGWMNNWDYANDIPTGSWRSSMTLPRDVRLVSTPRGPRLAQRVVEEIEPLLDHDAAWSAAPGAVSGTQQLPVTGQVLQIDAAIDLGTSTAAGITVLGDGETGTRIGYDARRGDLFVDRRNSGDTAFHPSFASLESAPVALDDGTVRFRVYVDRASVEVLTEDGLTTITDQVFPTQGADALTVWAEDGTAHVEQLTVTPVTPSMWAIPDAERPTLGVAVSPEADGRGGWHTGPATIEATAVGGEGELTLEQRQPGDDWAAYGGPVEVTEDGVHQWQFRATDAEGTVSEVDTAVVRVDSTRPVAQVRGLGKGRLNLARIRTVRIRSADAVSGVESTTVRLDGDLVDGSTVLLDAVGLRVGNHLLDVTVVDRAGHVDRQRVRFRVRATYAGAKELVRRIAEEGNVGPKAAKKLVKKIKVAGRADRRGQPAVAKKALKQVRKLARRKVSDKPTRKGLIRGARHLRRAL